MRGGLQEGREQRAEAHYGRYCKYCNVRVLTPLTLTCTPARLHGQPRRCFHLGAC